MLTGTRVSPQPTGPPVPWRTKYLTIIFPPGFTRTSGVLVCVSVDVEVGEGVAVGVIVFVAVDVFVVVGDVVYVDVGVRVGGTGVSVGGLEVEDADGVGDNSSTWTAVVQEVTVNKMSITHIFLNEGSMFKISLTFFNLKIMNRHLARSTVKIRQPCLLGE